MQTIDLEQIQARICAARPAGCAPTSRENAQNALPRPLVQTVWQLMGSMYGHRWTSSFGDSVDPDRVWAATLAGLDETQIRYGMRQCVNLALDWPPTAPEFRKLCLGESDVRWEHRRIEAADREFAERKRLTDARAQDQRDAEAFAAMAGIRDLLGIPQRGQA